MLSLPRVTALAVATASFASVGTAVAQAPESAFRAVGNTTMDVKSATQFSYLGVFVVKAGTNESTGVDPVAKGTMTVDAATRKKYRLPSSTVAKGVWKKNGESGGIRFVTTASMRKALKKVRTIPLTVSIDVDSPLNETARKKFTFGKPGRIIIRSSGDTFGVADEGGRG